MHNNLPPGYSDSDTDSGVFHRAHKIRPEAKSTTWHLAKSKALQNKKNSSRKGHAGGEFGRKIDEDKARGLRRM